MLPIPSANARDIRLARSSGLKIRVSLNLISAYTVCLPLFLLHQLLINNIRRSRNSEKKKPGSFIEKITNNFDYATFRIFQWKSAMKKFVGSIIDPLQSMLLTFPANFFIDHGE